MTGVHRHVWVLVFMLVAGPSFGAAPAKMHAGKARAAPKAAVQPKDVAGVYVPLDIPEAIETKLKFIKRVRDFERLNAQAEKGDNTAQLTLGLAYAQGRAFEDGKRIQDFDHAKSWLRKAAEVDNIDAQFALARLYSTGGVLVLPVPGLVDNFPEAEQWYLKAAGRNHIMAQMALGDLYSKAGNYRRNDTGFPDMYADAAKWYRAAADQGYLPAQFALARLYTKGLGVERDDDEAMHWYEAVVKHPEREKYQSDWGLISRAQRELSRLQREQGVPAFRQSLAPGDQTAQGAVLEIDAGTARAKIRTHGIPPVERWFDIEELYPVLDKADPDEDK